MENASKALLMAAAILIGMMIIGIFVYVFRAGGQVGEQYDQKQNQEQLELYNSKFEAFDKTNNTVSDIVSVFNLAYDANENTSYNSKKTVSVNVKIGNKTYCIPEKEMQNGARNYIFKGNSKSINTASNDKIYIYDLLNNTLADLAGTISSDLIKTSSIRANDNDKLTMVDNDMNYKYYFKCEEITYHEYSGRVQNLTFKLILNENYVE